MEPFVRKLLTRNDVCRSFRESGIRDGGDTAAEGRLGVVGLEDSGQGTQMAVLL